MESSASFSGAGLRRPSAILAEHIRKHGPIRTVRVSSAQAKGWAKGFPYWDAVRYRLRLDRKGRPVNVPLERAASIRRSYALAEEDALELADKEGRVRLQRIGRLDEHECLSVLIEIDSPEVEEAEEWLRISEKTSEVAEFRAAAEGTDLDEACRRLMEGGLQEVRRWKALREMSQAAGGGPVG